ncbi:chromatin-silencing transcriptional regulator TUP1 [Lipomyces japonicus]|uniref:chromatin-silencing transcriptional regulator TUP1 n=1 Tax=Lipomyces japonicus TaxID=56871 RepID=UPI0034CDDB93
MQQIRQNVYELEINHRKVKEHYEEEIARLKRELDARGGGHVAAAIPPGPAGGQVSAQPTQQPSATGVVGPPPSLGHSSSSVFQGIMSGQTGPALAPPQPDGAVQQQQHHHQQQQPGPPGLNAAAQPQPGSQPGYGPAGYLNGYHGAQQPQPQQPPQSQALPQQHQQQLPPHQQQQPPPPSQQQLLQQQLPQPQVPTQQAPPQAQPQTQHPQQAQPAAPTAVTTAAVSTPQIQNRAVEARTSPHVSRASPGPPQGNNLAELDFDRVPQEYKKQANDWFVIYNDRAPRILDVDLVHTLDHNSVVCCVRFSADGKYVATGCNRSAQIYDVQTGQRICHLQDESVEKEGDLYIRSVCFSPDGRYLATGAEDKQIRVWDIKTKTIRHLFSGHEQDIYSLDFARNGRHIASGSGDRTVRIWDMETGQCVLTLSIEDGVTTVAFSPDGRFVAAGSLDKSVRVWDATSGFLVERLEAPDGHKDSVYSVAFAPNGKDLVSGSLDKTIKLWELQSARGLSGSHKGGVCVKTFTGHKDFVLSVALTPDGQWVLSGSKDRGVQFWDPRTAQAQLMLQGHKNSVISVAPSPIGKLFATGSGDCRARIWQYSVNGSQ